jgi:hypothetical protein
MQSAADESFKTATAVPTPQAGEAGSSESPPRTTRTHEFRKAAMLRRDARLLVRDVLAA